MKLEILELAQLEIEDSKDFYNLQQDGLGDSFKSDVKKSIDKIVESPELYPIVVNSIRRTLLHRFPFSIMYTIQNNKIII
ncbi:MAG: hypothetical protein AB8B80_08095 [Marinicellaceae bacterium]